MRSFPLARHVRILVASLALLSLPGCDDPTASNALSGTYAATKFQVTPLGQPTIDVLAQGGVLTMTFASNGSVAGNLVVPGSVTGGAPLTASMAGTYTRSGSTVTLQQSADTFVRDLTWTVGSNTLEVVNQSTAGATFNITLTRQ